MVPQLLYRFIIGAIVLTLNAFPSRAYLSPLANDLVFVYASKPYAITNGAGNYATPAFVKLKWFPLANPRSETSAEVPNFEHSAFSPSGNYIALKGSGLSGKIYIFSFLDQSLVTLDLYEPTQEFLDDQQSITSGSLLWSPQGDRLAFTGVREVPASALDMQRADIYIFDLHQHKLTNATQDQSIVSNLVIPISWSPDGNWLLLHGAWSESKDEQNHLRPKFETRALSRDGRTLISVANGSDTCRLQWSPDMRWLASDTSCFEGFAGGSSGLLISPFVPTPIAQNNGAPVRTDQIVGPIRVGWADSRGMIYQYGQPVWINDNTLMAYRFIGPMTMGWMTESEAGKYSSDGLITFNVTSFSEVAVASNEFREARESLNNWFVRAPKDGTPGVAYNPLINKTIVLPSKVVTCPISYSIRIDIEGDFMAVLDACPYASMIQQLNTLKIFDTRANKEIAVRRMSKSEFLLPLGFIRLPLSKA